jgi:RNA polymerase sigma factor (sigma-70 family)
MLHSASEANTSNITVPSVSRFSRALAVVISYQWDRFARPDEPPPFSPIISTQHSLVGRLQRSGSESDWAKFYALYEKPILAFAAGRSLSESECCDVLQEIMVKMLRGGFSRFDPQKGRFTGFLFHVAHGCVIDAIRRRAVWQSRHLQIDDSGPASASRFGKQLPMKSETPADAAERQGQIALARAVLQFLMERKFFHAKTVEIFKAVTFEQRDPKETAAAFSTSVGNVYEAKRVVLAKLRSMLRALDEGFDLEQALTR